MIRNLFTQLKSNWKSGLSIAVVSVPLSLSFAIASGAAPIMGLITSAWAGITAALVGGSKFNVISPAGAFAGILTAVALQYGMSAIPIVTIMAGVIMFIGYLVNAQRFLTFIPGGAIFGFTLGIASIIAGTQLNSAFGLSGLTQHDSILLNIVESLKNISQLDITTTVVFVVILAILILLQKFVKKIPSIILVTPPAILLGWLATQGYLPFELVTLEGVYGNLSSQLIRWPELSFNFGLIVPAITIAVVGILETMLSAKIADDMTRTRHNERREMRGLALANVVSGIVGGMPATGVLGPTVLNITVGGKGRASAALKAIFVALITLLLFFLFKFIPMAAIAAILFFVAITMVQARKFLLYYRHDRFSLAIGLLVAAITLYKDPALGILIGSVIGLLLFAEKVSRGSYEAVHNARGSKDKIYIAGERQFASHANYDILVYSFKGALTHLNGEAHLRRLEQLDDHVTHVVLRLREVSFVDLEGIDGFDAIIDMLNGKKTDVLLTGVSPHVLGMLKTHSRHYPKLSETGQVFKKTRFALEHLGVPPAPVDQK